MNFYIHVSFFPGLGDVMSGNTVRLIESIKNEGFHEGVHAGKMKLIKDAYKTHSVEEIADFLSIPISEIRKYLEM